MTRVRCRQSRDRRQTLTRAEWLDLLGGRYGSAFCYPLPDTDPKIWQRDERARQEAWAANRDELIIEYAEQHPGHRPEAYWQYDCIDASLYSLPDYDPRLDDPDAAEARGRVKADRLRYLARHGLLLAGELADLREQVERGRPTPAPTYQRYADPLTTLEILSEVAG